MSATVTALKQLSKPSLSRRLMEQALLPHILLGMPQLASSGLSETWLMKELGHRHWYLLAMSMGMHNADFRDEKNRPVYAAICATSLRSTRLHEARADDILEIRSLPYSLSRTKALSRHMLLLNGEPAGQVELISTFVVRQDGKDNNSIGRVRLDSFDLPTINDCALVDLHRSLRNGQPGAHLDIPFQQEWVPVRQFTPSLVEDFNGAGLFYFTYFQSLITRSCDDTALSMASKSMRRDMFFLGNINAGDSVTVERAGSSRIHRLVRCDGKVIAVSFFRQDA